MYKYWKDGSFRGSDGKEYLIAAVIMSSKNPIPAPDVHKMYFEQQHGVATLCVELSNQRITIKESDKDMWFISGPNSPYRINKKWNEIIGIIQYTAISMNEGVSELFNSLDV